MPTPSVIMFDVDETLSDLKPMSQRFADVGLPAQLAQTWFAQVRPHADSYLTRTRDAVTVMQTGFPLPRHGRRCAAERCRTIRAAARVP